MHYGHRRIDGDVGEIHLETAARTLKHVCIEQPDVPGHAKGALGTDRSGHCRGLTRDEDGKLARGKLVCDQCQVAGSDRVAPNRV